MQTDYPEYYEQLQQAMANLQKRVPGVMGAFGSLHQCATNKAVLSKRVKELIALGIAVTVRCDGCIAYHVHDALDAGATPEEIAETIGVAVLMGGGPAVVYGAQAFDALSQFTEGVALARS